MRLSVVTSLLALATLVGLASGPVRAEAAAEATQVRYNFTARVPQPDARYRRQTVDYATNEKPGTIVIDTNRKCLYLVLGDGKAIRYGIGVGRDGFSWKGVEHVSRKAEWPTWTPPAEMIARQPELAAYATGMPGGPNNPLGARALYLGSTLYRIHGTAEPWSIGRAVSSGCIRLLNEDVIDLYERVRIGAKVVVQ